jgi:hypothetical protein
MGKQCNSMQFNLLTCSLDSKSAYYKASKKTQNTNIVKMHKKYTKQKKQYGKKGSIKSTRGKALKPEKTYVNQCKNFIDKRRICSKNVISFQGYEIRCTPD